MPLTNITPLLTSASLFEKGVKFIPNTDIEKISGKIVKAYNVYTNKKTTIQSVHTIVLAIGNAANDDLYLQLENKVKNLFLIGDGLAPRKVLEAISEGAAVGRLI